MWAITLVLSRLKIKLTTNNSFANKILVLNTLQGLISHKTKSTNQHHNILVMRNLLIIQLLPVFNVFLSI